MAFATIQITQGAIVGGSGESVIGLASDANVTLTDDGGAGATSYLWEIIGFPAPDSAAPTINNSDTQIATVLYGSGFTDGVYIVRLTRNDPSDGVSTDVRFFAVEDADGLSLPTAGMNYTMSNVGGSAAAQVAGWFGAESASTNIFLDAFLRQRRAREGYSKVSSNDTTFGLLEDKIAAGTGIAVQTLNDGANESVEVSSTSLVAISPSQITSNQNDYSPTGWSSSGVVRLSTDASRTITGFSATATQSLKQIVNVGSNDLVLAHQDSGSSAANRITTADGEDLTLTAGQSATLWYDTTSTTWRVLVGSASATATLTSVLDTFSATGGQTAFTLSESPLNNIVTMTVEGIVQEDGDVLVSGTSVTYSGLTLSAGDDVEFRYVTGSGSGVATSTDYAPIEATTELAWKLNESAAPYASSGQSSLNLTTTGSPTSVIAHPLGYVLDMDAAGDLLSSGDTAVGETSGSITVHFWIRWESHTVSASAVAKNYNTGTTWSGSFAGVNFGLITANTGDWRAGVNISTSLTQYTATSRLPRYIWTHVAMVHDGSSISLYQDGIYVGGGAAVGTIDWGNSGGWFVGCAPEGSSGLTGQMADVRVEHKVLTALELVDVVRAGRGLLWGPGSGGGGVSESEISAQLTANVNDYSPTGWSDATVVRLSTDGSDYDITGVDASATAIRKTFINVDSTQSITLKHEDSNSTAANRIITHGTDFVLGPNDICHVLYDSTSSRWRVY